MNKTLYHSELVKLGEIAALVKSDVTPSKYQGKSPFVVLEIDGSERLYNCENERCEGKLMLRKGQVLTLKATGSRDDADIEILSGSDAQSPEANSTEGRVAPSPAQAPVRQQQNQEQLASCIDDAIGVLDSRLTTLVETATPDARLDAVLRVAMSLFIQGNK